MMMNCTHQILLIRIILQIMLGLIIAFYKVVHNSCLFTHAVNMEQQ